MPIIESWNALTDSDWDAFAAAWIKELREASGDAASEVEQSVVMMGFTATAEHQWRFINAAMNHAKTDDELRHIAAGPFEQLLGEHGDDYICVVEQKAESDPKFARMITGAWQHLMTNSVWQRVKTIQAACLDPLTNGDPNST